jgi:hypothetical protein
MGYYAHLPDPCTTATEVLARDRAAGLPQLDVLKSASAGFRQHQ